MSGGVINDDLDKGSPRNYEYFAIERIEKIC
jgi:hypothetical protein